MKSTSHGIVDLAHQVGEEEHRALEHADQQQVPARVVARDLGAELADPVLQVVGLDEDLADRGVAHAERAVLSVSTSRGPAVRPRTRSDRRARTTRARAVAEVERARRSPQREHLLGAARRPRHGAPVASSASRRTTSRAQRRRQRRAGGSSSISSRPREHRRRRARRAPRPRRAAARRVRSTLRSAAGWTSRSAGSEPSRTRVAREASIALVGVLAPGAGRARGSTRRSPRAYAEQRPHEPPVARRMPSSARRPGEERGGRGRLGLVGGGVAGGDGAAPRRSAAAAA